MKLSKSSLTRMIKEELQFILGEKKDDVVDTTNTKAIDEGILTLQKMRAELDEAEAIVAEQNEKIGKLDKAYKAQFKQVSKLMEAYKLSMHKVDKWIATYNDVKKYIVTRNDYKELWEEALEKLNGATKAVLVKMAEAQWDAKDKMMVKQLDVKAEGILKEGVISDVVSKFWSKIKGLAQSILNLQKIVNNLPEAPTK